MKLDIVLIRFNSSIVLQKGLIMLLKNQKMKMWSVQGMQQCGLWSVPILLG